MTASTLNIFRAGTWTANNGQTLTFSESDVAAIAAVYDPAKHEAPLVIGHPALDDPAYGWVAALETAPSGLEATPRKVDPKFAMWVNEERFNRISSSLFPPDSPSNPVPGSYYLRHVGFLGAATEAVKGLRKPRFVSMSEDDGTITIEFPIPAIEFSAPVIEVPPVAEPTKDQPANVGTVDYAAKSTALEAENAALKATLAQRDAEIAAAQSRQLRSEITNFAESLIERGCVLPRDKAGLVEFLVTIPLAQNLEFASADDGNPVKTGARAWALDFLNRLPVQVDFSERTAGAAAHDPVAQFSAPPGYAVDESQLAKHQQALALVKARGIPYAQAIHEIG